MCYMRHLVSARIFFSDVQKSKRRCDGRVTVKTSTLQGFRNFVLAIVLVITVYKALYQYNGGSTSKEQLGKTVDRMVR